MVASFQIPILLNVFNRPEETSQVLAILNDLKPGRLFVHCDGPRPNRSEDIENVTEVRRIIHDGVTWPCELKCLFEETNLGCGRGPATAMTWFFTHVEEGIVLEDDCCPHPDFFPYCQQLLDKYRNDERIGIISGTCFSKITDHLVSYRFSAYAGIWGWATWKRTWDLFDFNFQKSDDDFIRKVKPFVKSRQATDYWLNILHKCEKDGPGRSYWDYQLHLCLLYANKIHILPNKNLVTNIGFNQNATHTFDQGSAFANKSTEGILPLIHPKTIHVAHRLDNADYFVPLTKRIKRLLKRFFHL